MLRQPRGDTLDWDVVLAYRSADIRSAVADRLQNSGIPPRLVRDVVADAGDQLYAAARSGEPGWADRFGGPLAVALLAAEVSALTAHLTSRASSVRASAVDALLDEYSAVTIAARLGISRQKVYEVGRGPTTNSFIDRVPWRQA